MPSDANTCSYCGGFIQSPKERFRCNTCWNAQPRRFSLICTDCITKYMTKDGHESCPDCDVGVTAWGKQHCSGFICVHEGDECTNEIKIGDVLP